ncbi:MAG: SH3 domain-containing protein [Planctomycetota bacterium]
MGSRARCAVLLLILPCVLAAGEDAPEPPYIGAVTGDRVYIRGGDGINYTVLTVADQGDRVRVRDKRFQWLAIDVPDHCTVWVHKTMLDVSPDGKEATLARDRVNVRARPGLKGDILGQLPQGAAVKIVDRDGDWAGIAPPPQARAWVHGKYVRKVADAGAAPKPTTRAPAEGGLDRAAGLALLGEARKAYAAELAKKPDERDFSDVLSAYKKIAAKCRDQTIARRAEQARQRLLKIVDLHETLRGLREPLDQFEAKYKKLEEEYERRAKPPED